jgi:hypothetical protein
LLLLTTGFGAIFKIAHAVGAGQLMDMPPSSELSRSYTRTPVSLGSQLLPDLGPGQGDGADLSIHTREQRDAVDAELNSGPRKTLDWDTPAERLAVLLATSN